MKKLLSRTCKSLVIFLFSLIVFAVFTQTTFAQEPGQDETLEGTIVAVKVEEPIDPTQKDLYYQLLEVLVTRGSLKGQTIDIENNTISVANSQRYEVGDKVVFMLTVDFEGNNLYFITDYVRREGLLLLFILFAVLTITVAGKWGVYSLIGMAISFGVIFWLILPLILKGINPVVAAILGSLIIIPVTFFLSHGYNRKTLIAAVGTLITLIITGVLAVVFVDATRLTGFATEEAGFLSFAQQEIDMKGILLAGIIIGTLGVLDDITVSQSSIVSELSSANKKLKPGELFTHAMKVGRDHIASLVNTLVLVYTGASLPLLLLFLDNPSPIVEVINLELIADEIVRTLVGSIGLVLAVPITTFLAVVNFNKSKIT